MKESVTLGALIRLKQLQRDELQRQVDEFHAKGGKTQYLEPGETSGTTMDYHRSRRKRK